MTELSIHDKIYKDLQQNLQPFLVFARVMPKDAEAAIDKAVFKATYDVLAALLKNKRGNPCKKRIAKVLGIHPTTLYIKLARYD